MESCPDPLLRRRAAAGSARESCLCLRLPSRKKKVAYSAYLCKLLNQTRHAGDSCAAAVALGSLHSPRLLAEVALEAARLSCCGRRRRLSHRVVLLAVKMVLLAMKVVLLRELCKTNLGSAGWQLLMKGLGKM